MRIRDLNSRLSYSYQLAKLPFLLLSYFYVILTCFIIHCHVQFNVG